MKVWVLQHTNVAWRGWWTGNGLACSTRLNDAVLFVRRLDAERALLGNQLLNASPVEMIWPVSEPLPNISKELPDGDEPRGQSAAVHQEDGGAVSSNEPSRA